MNGRPLLLDLFSGAGGAAMGYHRAGFDVIGIDIKPQPNYPFEFHQMDWRDGLLKFWPKFDVVHASPPCQGYLNLTRQNTALGRRNEHRQLIDVVHEAFTLLNGFPYVIENVADARAHMVRPVRICGTGLGLPLRRHRLFESNLPIVGIPCDHKRFSEPKYWTGWRPNGEKRLSTVVQVYGNAGGKHEWPAAMGIDWATYDEIAEAIPPAYSEHIGAQLLKALERAA